MGHNHRKACANDASLMLYIIYKVLGIPFGGSVQGKVVSGQLDLFCVVRFA